MALPSWVPLSDDEVLRFFAAIQEALPDTWHHSLQHRPSGRFLTGRDYRRILEVAPNLAGSKHTGGDVGSLIEIVQATPELAHFVVDGQIVPGALFGAKGFYSFVANLSPAFALELWRCCRRRPVGGSRPSAETGDAFFRAWLAELRRNHRVAGAGEDRDRGRDFAGDATRRPCAVPRGEERDVAALRRLVAGALPEEVGGVAKNLRQ